MRSADEKRNPGIRYQKWYPLIAMSPGVAKAMANDGWKKDDIRKYLYDNVRMPAGWFGYLPTRNR